MQLQYNIIWVDDEIKKFEEVGDIERVRMHLLGLGFIPYILQLSGGRDIDKYFSITKFDLIISDLSIEEGHHGDDIIKEIRKKNIFTEVLFYSSQNDLKTIATKLLTVDRVSFHSGRRELIEKIEDLISLSVSRLLELNATRGLITSETSELDVTIEEIVMELVYNKLKLSDTVIQEKIDKYVDDFLKKTPEIFLKKYNALGFKKGFHNIEAKRKWRIFRELLKQVNSKETIEFLASNKSYADEVIDIRNKFAHAKAFEKDGKLFLSGFGPEGEAFEFNAEQCIEIRKKLIDHRNTFNTLTTHLGLKN